MNPGDLLVVGPAPLDRVRGRESIWLGGRIRRISLDHGGRCRLACRRDRAGRWRRVPDPLLVSCCCLGLGIDKLAELSTDPEFAKLLEALAKRWDPDPAIPSAGIGIQTYASFDNPEPELWLEIEISYTGACDATPNDPCEELVDELAAIVFDNYARVDELTGIHISITNSADFGVVEFSDTLIHKALTIEEWRKELSLENDEGARCIGDGSLLDADSLPHRNSRRHFSKNASSSSTQIV